MLPVGGSTGTPGISEIEAAVQGKAPAGVIPATAGCACHGRPTGSA